MSRQSKRDMLQTAESIIEKELDKYASARIRSLSGIASVEPTSLIAARVLKQILDLLTKELMRDD